MDTGYYSFCSLLVAPAYSLLVRSVGVGSGKTGAYWFCSLCSVCSVVAGWFIFEILNFAAKSKSQYFDQQPPRVEI
jgi:hypothetical protein